VESTEKTAAEPTRAKNLRYYLANKERLNEYSSAYQKKHRQKHNAQRRASYDKTKRAAKKAYYERNKERILKQKQEYFIRKIDSINDYRKRNRREISAQNSRWHRNNRDRIRDRKREESRRRASNPSNRVASALRRRIAKLLKGLTKPDRSERLIGCQFKIFIEYIKAQFKPGMSMKNYGRAWHIDHIIPCSAFDLTNESQVRQCFHFSNMRPMWAKANLRKGAKITEPQLRLLL
jgi:hypothetical protein